MLIIYTLIILIFTPYYYKSEGILIFKITSAILIGLCLLSYNTLDLNLCSTYAGFNGCLISNNCTVLLHIVLFIVTSIICNFIPRYYDKSDILGYHVLIVLLAVIGSYCMISCNNLITLYISLEIQSLSLYLISTIFNKTERNASSGLIYLIVGAFASALILLGLAKIYESTGNWELTDLNTLTKIYFNDSASVGYILLLIGLLVKVSAAPIHFWAPKVYNNTPTIVSIWLIVLPKLSIFSVIMNINIVGSNNHIIVVIALIISVISLIIGSILGVTQVYLKKLLTYSTISHVGLILIPICIYTATVDNDAGYIFYLIQYTLTNLGILGVLIMIGKYNADIIYIRQLNTILNFKFGLTISIIILLFSLAGIPPLIGLYAKLNVLESMIANDYVLPSIIAVVSSVISTSYYLKIIVNIIRTTSVASTSAPLSSGADVSSVQTYTLLIIVSIVVFFQYDPNQVISSLITFVISKYTV